MPELRDAFRSLRSTPLLTAVAVLSLALGIGANTAIFSLLDAALFRALPVPEPERLVIVGDAGEERTAWPQAVWNEIRDREVLAGGFAWFWSRFDTAERGERQLVDGLAASGRMFEALQLRAVIGRMLAPADDVVESGPDGLTAVISHRLWRERFGGSPDVLRRTITIDGRHFTIVGVMPPEFTGLYVGLPVDVVIPLGESGTERRPPYVTIMGRLTADQTPESVTSMLRAMQPAIRATTNPYEVSPYREEYLREPFTVRAAPAGVSFLEGRYGQPLRILLGVAGLVLVIACGNLAMLLVARALARHHELGVRAALGATTHRLAWQLGLECLLLATSGVALGLVFAHWCAGLIVSGLSTQAYSVALDVGPDWRVFGFASAAGFVTVLLFGTPPALYAWRIQPIDAWRMPTRGVTRARAFGPGGVVVAQVAISLILVIATGLFLRTFRALASADVGFEPDRVVIVTVDARKSAFPSERRDILYERLTEAVAGASRVESAAASLAVPGGNLAFTPWIELPDGTALPQGPTGVYGNRISAGWFETLGTRLLAGRELQRADRPGAPGVVIVNQSFAERFLGTTNPVGRTIVLRSAPDGAREPLEVVGVVENAMYRLIKELPPPSIYMPLAQMSGTLPPGVSLTVRAEALDAALTRQLAAALLGVDRDLSLTFRTLEDQVSAQYAQERLVARVATIFGALALLLAGLGLYGVTAHAVAQRRVEIGIRLAVGAEPRAVMRLVLVRTMLLVAGGVGLGLMGAVAAARAIRSMLFNVEPGDPATIVGSCALLVAAGALAAWHPARRAARIDPASVLRNV